MSYQVIANFPGGLDARKYKLSLPPGTLTTLKNAHINAGGEIEKRKAFGKMAGYGAASLVSGTFGMQETATGILVFGSSDLASQTYPTGFGYQRLQHPAVLAGTTYSAGSHAMTAIVHSEVFGSYAFVVAQFADGYQFAYYNGALVNDFVAGVVLPYINTNAKLAAHLTRLINNTVAYTALQDATPNDHKLDAYSIPGNSYSAQLSVYSLSNITVQTNSETGFTSATISSTDNTNAGNGSTVTIGGKVYTFKTTLTPTEGEVLIGTTIGGTLTNLYNAINNTGTPNTDYKCAAINANVQAQGLVTVGEPYFQVVARTANTAGEIANAIAGTNYAKQDDTVSKQLAAPAQGQFKIAAINSPAYATATITNLTNPAVLHSITVGAKTYLFRGSVVNPNDVLRGATAVISLDNLISAINATPSGAGSLYGTGTTANAQVTASAQAAGVTTLTAIALGTSGNSIALTQSNTDYTLSGATLSDGTSNGITSIKVGPIYSTATLVTNLTNPSNGDTVTIGATTYTFKTTVSTDGDILISANATATLQNLIDAINQTGVQGVDYNVGQLNQQVTALPSVDVNTLRLIARNPGVIGNAISLTVTGSTLTLSSSTLAGGNDTIELLSATLLSITGQTKYDYTKAIVAAINSYSATSGFKATFLNETVFLKPVASNSFSNSGVVQVTTTGQVAIGFCAFSLNISSKTISSAAVASLQLDGLDILNGSQSFSTTVAELCSAIATAVNNSGNTANNGVYVAVPQGNTIYLSKVITRSDDNSINVAVNLTGTGLGVSEISNSGLSALVSPNSITVPAHVRTGYSTDFATCKPTGGFPPYTYSWIYDSGDSSFQAVSPKAPVTNFSRTESDGAANGKMSCRVVDSQNNTVVSNPVSLHQN